MRQIEVWSWVYTGSPWILTVGGFLIIGASGGLWAVAGAGGLGLGVWQLARRKLVR